MGSSRQLPRAFFARPAGVVAREILGARLVRFEGDRRMSGTILEVEAYSGEEDLGCHCRVGRTARTQVMYGPPGHAYVYFTYGMHWCLNFVVDQEGYPAAVLVRAILADEGLDLIASRREGIHPQHWTDGPAKLTKALNIDKTFNLADLCCPEADLFVEAEYQVPGEFILRTSRIGLNNVPEPWKSIPWRYLIAPGKLDELRSRSVGSSGPYHATNPETTG